jgi:hypothetical protein
MKERLFLDWIALHAAYVAPRYVQSAATVVADLANSRLAFRDGTAMPAGVAANPATIEFFVKIALTNVLVNNVTQGGHRKPLQAF